MVSENVKTCALSPGDGAIVSDRRGRLEQAVDTGGFISFTRSLIVSLKRVGKRRTAERYTTAVNSFERFRHGSDVRLSELDSDVMMAYESYLASVNVCPNTVSFYMRNLRAIYNRAVDKCLVLQCYPFRHVYTGIDKTVKRAVPLSVIRRIRDLELSSSPGMEYARDVFMFSFYARGMSLVDIAFLRKSDLRDGVLSYRRHKTKRLLTVRIEAPLQSLIDKYHEAGSVYVMPIVRGEGTDERRLYGNAVHRINRNLKKIGRMLGLNMPLTTYVARHGWASIAMSKSIPVSVISEAMGHDSEMTTRIYLASLDSSVVDDANSLILNSL